MGDHLLQSIALFSLWAAGAFAVSGSSSDGGNPKQQDIHVDGPDRPGRLLRQEEPLLVRGLWDWWENPHKDSEAAGRAHVASAGASAAAPLAYEKAAGAKQRVTFGANGALLKMRETPEDRGNTGGTGGIAWRFIARDGRKIANTGKFDGPVELSKRLAEVEDSCPLVLGKGWTLIDSADDTEGGHHWILQGPIDGKRSLLHVSSVIKGKEEGHGILRFSPRKSCGPSVLLQEADNLDNTSNTSNINFNEPASTTLTNQNVVDSWLWTAEKLKTETAANCNDFQKIDNITLISARLEVAAGLNVFMTVSVTPVNASVAVTYHTFRCDWHVKSTGSATLDPDLILPYRESDDTQLGWCELLRESTHSGLVQLASIEGHQGVANLHRRLGWLGIYRDFRPNPDLVELEDLTNIKEKARQHLEMTCPIRDVNSLDTDWTPEITMPSCFSVDTIVNQGECASCWAFSVATSLAQRLCIQFPIEMGVGSLEGTKKLSTQQMLSCNPTRLGCEGGSMTSGVEEAMKGISLESDYEYNPSIHEWPWHRNGEKCNWGNVAHPFIVTGHILLSYQGEGNIRKELYCNGPVVTGFLVMANWINFFEGTNAGAVYTSADGPNCMSNNVGGHAVSMFAWGLKDGVNYWKLANSWGPQWGDSGNFKMERGQDLCGIETLLVLGGTVEKTTGTWHYTDWSSCDGTSQKTRSIQCMNNDLVTPEVDETLCPTYNNWPVKATFPDPNSNKQEEMVAIRDCTETVSSCSRHTACNSNGDAARDYLGVCHCTCDPWYVNDDCGACSDDSDGYPHCRQKCTADQWCNSKGVVSGNVWMNEFGVHLNNCQCDCNVGFAGDSCDQCVGAETWPDCAEVHHHGVVGGTFTYTTTWPPCQVWQGPIELEPPPVGSNPRAVLRCDVRSLDCSPNREKCITDPSYMNLCRWNGTFCVAKDDNAALEQNIRLYLTGNSYATPLEATGDQSSKVITWQNGTLGLMPSELGLQYLAPHR